MDNTDFTPINSAFNEALWNMAYYMGITFGTAALLIVFAAVIWHFMDRAGW